MKNQWWALTKKTKDVGYSYEVKEKFKYFKGSTIAIVLGLVAAMVIVGIQNVNPFDYLGSLIGISFNGLYVNNTIQWICIYIVAGLAISIAFKSGSFNIGVAGQMMLGAGLSIIFVKEGLFNQAGLTASDINGGHIVVIFLITVLSGALLAGFAGILKAFFNIHEVVTTIMLNWTVWYLFKYLFTTFAAKLGGEGIQTSAAIPGNLLNVGSSPVLIPILIAIITLVIVGLVLSKTVFGFKIKAVGSSPDASKYAGYDVKQKIIQAMVLSGTLAGIASFINVMTITPNLSFSIDNLPSLGYDSIAVSLVAFNNPIGIFFTSILWGTLQSSGSSAASLYGIAPQLSNLIFGVIVYFAAISVVFMNYYPILKLRVSSSVIQSRKSRQKLMELYKEQNKQRLRLARINSEKPVLDYKQDFMIAKNQVVAVYERSDRNKSDRKVFNEALNKLKAEMSIFMKEYRRSIHLEINKLGLEIERLKKDTYTKQINAAKSGIERRHFANIRRLETTGLESLVSLKNDRLVNNDALKNAAWTRLHEDKLAKKVAKANLKKSLLENKYWYEGQYGELTGYYLMVNTKIENRGEIKKQEIFLKNEIASLKADYRFEKSQALLADKKAAKKSKVKQKALNKEIVALQAEFKKLKAAKLKEINKVSLAYKQTVNELKPTGQLESLKAQKVKMDELSKLEYHQKLEMIEQNKVLVQAKFNEQKSEGEYDKVQQLVTAYWTKSHHSTTELSQAEQPIQSFDKLQLAVNKIYDQQFNDYDSPKFIKKRTQLLNKLNCEQERILGQVVIIKTDQKIAELKIANKKILQAYDQQIKKINEEYKFQVKAIKNNPDLPTYERNNQLIAQQDYYDLEVSNLIADIETKFSKNLTMEVI